MSEFPRHAWRYHLRLRIEGSDRNNLPDCLEDEQLALFHYMSRKDVYNQIREGELHFAQSLTGPLPAFAEDLAVLSVYLFQIVKGLEVAERWASPDRIDDVRAWKVIARQGQWVKVPLRVRARAQEPGIFDVDPDAEDLDVMSAQWETYPRWFQDGMRRKHPTLRRL